MLYIVLFACSFLLSSVLTPLARSLARRRGWVSAPVLERHIHTMPVPRIGGAAIFATLVIIASLFSSRMQAAFPAVSMMKLAAILGAGGLVFLVGLYDDLHGIGPYGKIAAQVVAAVVLYGAGLKIERMQLLFGPRHFGPALSLALTIFWVLLITNALNLIDGLDGLAAGSALFAVFALFVVSLAYENHLAALLSLILAGALLGFLRFNFNPASIFLGDCGSLLVGFTLAALGLAGSQKAVVALALPVIALSLPLVDTGLAVLRRFLNGKPIFGADREHIHHKLLARGLTHRQVTLLLYAVSALFGALSLLLVRPGAISISLVSVLAVAAILIGLHRLGYHEIEELRRLARRSVDQKSVITNDLTIRRAIDDLKRSKTLPEVCAIVQRAFQTNDFDGFEFTVVPAGIPFGDLGPFMPAEMGRLRFAWQKNGHGPACTAAWSLYLDLVTDGQPSRGCLRVFRAHANGSLMVDVNLLTSDFRLTLANALARAMADITPAEKQFPAEPNSLAA